MLIRLDLLQIVLADETYPRPLFVCPSAAKPGIIYITNWDNRDAMGKQGCAYDLNRGKATTVTTDWKEILLGLCNPRSDIHIKYKKKYPHLFSKKRSDICFTTPLVEPVVATEDDMKHMQAAVDFWDGKTAAAGQNGEQ